MNKIFIFLVLSVLFIIIGLVFYKKNLLTEDKSKPDLEKKVSFLDEKDKLIVDFKVETATSTAQIMKGLMHRESLDKDRGMLFIFSREKKLSFWMKNTLIPLDMIFISKDHKVVSISHNAQPCKTLICPKYSSSGSVQYVLEVNGGLAKELAIKKGTKASFSF